MDRLITNKISISGAEVWPIIEGGKGIGLTNGATAGAFAAAGCVGTFSGVTPQKLDENGTTIPYIFAGKNRIERHEELVQQSIEGALSQAFIAHETASGRGRIHINVLWEMGGSQRILRGVLEKAKGTIHGITCGAGLPYKLAEIASEFSVYYYPIISSMRAFRALWKRSYHKFAKLLGGVVYEDPWVAGGHNGLSNSDDPLNPEKPWNRVLEIREFMNSIGLSLTPIIVAGGVWNLSEWKDWIVPESKMHPIGFQFGTRPLLTKESPIPDHVKRVLTTVPSGSIALNRFSPTGFYSSALKNKFLSELYERSERQVPFSKVQQQDYTVPFQCNSRGDLIYISEDASKMVSAWIKSGFTEIAKTPDSTIIFLTPEKLNLIRTDQINCTGCLSACRFSNWSENSESHSTGCIPDPRSFCIRATLYNVSTGSFNHENELVFCGKNGFRFSEDPLYKNNYIPSIAELVDCILAGK